MTPAPTTISFFGGTAKLNAPVDETICLLVDLHTRQPRVIGPGRDDDRFGVERNLIAVEALDAHPPGRGDAPVAAHPVDLVLLEQIGHAVDIGRDGHVLVLHHRREIELRRRNDNSERRKSVSRVVEHFGRVQERLGRDAADIEAGPAERLHLLDDRDLHAQLRRTNGAHIAARPRADHYQVICHCRSLSLGAREGVAAPATTRSIARTSSRGRRSKSPTRLSVHR